MNLSTKKAYDRAYKRRIREAGKAMGLCADCGKQEPLPGIKLCKGCRETARRSAIKVQTKKRDAWRSLGLCHRCGKEAVPGGKLCGYHVEKRYEHCRTYRAKLVADGKCFACGHPLDEPGFKRCIKCRQSQREKAARLKRIGKGNTVLKMEAR